MVRKGASKGGTASKRAKTSEAGESSGRELVVAQGEASQPRRVTMIPNALKGPGGMPKTHIHAGAFIDRNMSDCDMWKLVEKLELLKFFEIVEPVCPNLVKHFYKYLRVVVKDDGVALIVNINGIEKTYSSSDFLMDFGLETDGYDFFEVGSISNPGVYVANVLKYNKGKCPPNWEDVRITQKTVYTNGTPKTVYIGGHRPFLTGEEYLVFKVVRDGIFPSQNKSLTPTQNELMIYTALVEEVKLNLPVLIARHMQFTLESSRSSTLPYGAFVTFLMKKLGGINGVVNRGDKVVTISKTSCPNFMLYYIGDRWLTKAERLELRGEENVEEEEERPRAPRQMDRLRRIERSQEKIMRNQSEANRVFSENTKRVNGNLQKAVKFFGDVVKALMCRSSNDVDERAFPPYPDLEEVLPYPPLDNEGNVANEEGNDEDFEGEQEDNVQEGGSGDEV